MRQDGSRHIVFQKELGNKNKVNINERFITFVGLFKRPLNRTAQMQIIVNLSLAFYLVTVNINSFVLLLPGIEKKKEHSH